MKWINEEKGIAAITVLLVTFVMAISGAVVLFSATTDLETAARDTRAEGVFATSEAGLDLGAAHIFSNPTFSETGQTETCLDNPLVPADAGFSCADPNADPEIEITSPSNGRFVYPLNGRPFIEYTVISRSKEGEIVTRTLGATYRVEALELPFGMFVNGAVDLNGNPTLFQESLLVNGPVTSREKVDTDANNNNQFDDPDLGWRFHRDRIQSNPEPKADCTDPSTGGIVGCSGVFSNFQIYEQNQQKNQNELHYPCSSACPASNKYPTDRDSHQTKVVNGVPQPVVTIPTDAILEPMEAMKRLAQQQGLYYNYKNGQNNNVIFQPGDIGAPAADFPRNSVVYIDADAGDSMGWKIDLAPGDPDSDMLFTNGAGERVGLDSGILIVRGGTLRLESNTLWSGAIFAPEGEFRILGGAVCTCTIYSQGFSAQGGNSTIQLTPDWFNRLPAGLVSVRRTSFFECEQYQDHPLCPPPPT
jgi:hypothetical protein